MRIIGNDPNKPRQTAATASGTLPNGKPVVINSDGTVSSVSETSVNEVLGSETVFTTNYARYMGSAYDSTNDRVVIVYRDDSDTDKTKVVLGQISGTTVTFGTPALMTTDIMINPPPVVFDSANNKVVVFHTHSTSPYPIKAYVGTVSGSSISFGTAVTAYAGYSGGGGNSMAAATFDSSNSKIVLVWRDESNSNYGTAKVGTVSGTSISFGSAVVFHSTYVYNPEITYDSGNSKVVVAYRDVTAGDGKAVVGTVSGTSISFGSTAQYESGEPNEIDIGYESSTGTVVVGYKDDNNFSYGTAAVGTVSGTSISFGTPVVFNNSGNTNYIKVVGSPDAGKVLVVYKDSNNDGSYQVGTVSGTSISFTAEADFNAANTNEMSVAYDTTNKVFLITYHDQPNSNYGTGIVLQIAYTSTNITAENYIGMSGGVLEDISRSESTGSSVVYESAELGSNSVAYDSTNNKIVITYRDAGNSGYGTAVVGTVSGTSITFGTPVVFYSASINNLSSVFDSSNGKIVTTYRNASLYPSSRVGTVSGTSISYGSEVVITASNNAAISSVYDSTNNKVVVTYAGAGGGTASTVVGTVSGTSISYGSATTTEAAYNSSMGFDTTNGKVILFLYTTSQAGNARVGTVSGTSITFGSAATVPSNVQYLAGVVHDSSANKMVIGYTKSSGPATAIVGTVSGTSISFGSETEVQTSATSVLSMGFDSLVNKVVYTYRYGPSPYNGRLRVGTVSGTSITFASEVTFESGTTSNLAIGYDSTESTSVISYRDEGNSNYGTAVGFQAAGSYQSRGEVADGGNAVVDVQGGISDIQENLTAGQSYYVQTNGTISTTAGDPSVFAGTAVSSTKLIVKG